MWLFWLIWVTWFDVSVNGEWYFRIMAPNKLKERFGKVVVNGSFLNVC